MAHPHKAEHDRNKDARVHKIAGKGAETGVIEGKIKRAFKEHDKQLHGGAKTHLKFAAGGSIPGAMPKARGDRPSRHKGGKKGTTVNVVVAGHPPAPPMPSMPPAGMNMAPPPMVRPPVPAGPGPMMPPPGMMARKKGGAVKYTGGAADGVGRLEKVENYGKKARQIAPENR